MDTFLLLFVLICLFIVKATSLEDVFDVLKAASLSSIFQTRFYVSGQS